MKLHLVKNRNGDPIIWTHKSQKATVAGFVSVIGVVPFLFLFVFPYASVLWFAVVNFVLDIYRNKKRAYRWADIIRRFRFALNGGYWRVISQHQVRLQKWGFDHFKGRRY
ncbi:hypothetical protein MARSALSMR5_04183 (plasmid) [Marinobacter salarius]|uniref:Uncharacterized protein n=1 Tax=Marinobacter salarius TaxID=1420917 RepID=A0A1W6KFM9_9GAMM|nr:hypothetical protein MARSALSMR5_04183 [Marinobacter salarius]